MNEPQGRAKGGLARKAALSPSRRKEIAKTAAAARYARDVKVATHGTEDHPLRIGDIEIPAYVLEDETRVLSQRGVIGGLGMKYGSRADGADRLAGFLGGKGISPFVSSELLALINNPIKFRAPHGGTLAFGYPATILADVCDVVLNARKAGALQKQQEHIAEQCELLVRGFARVGIIALVDEATGYQRDRTKDALSRILEAFIEKELQPWLRTFPADFYQEMFRLRGLPYDASSVKRPPYFGHLTNDIVYDRLAPSVLDELKFRIPRNDEGRPTAKFSQLLTRNIGYPKLREHLGAVIATMRLSSSWADFIAKLDRNYPRFSGATQHVFSFQIEHDEGKGL